VLAVPLRSNWHFGTLYAHITMGMVLAMPLNTARGWLPGAVPGRPGTAL